MLALDIHRPIFLIATFLKTDSGGPLFKQMAGIDLSDLDTVLDRPLGPFGALVALRLQVGKLCLLLERQPTISGLAKGAPIVFHGLSPESATPHIRLTRIRDDRGYYWRTFAADGRAYQGPDIQAALAMVDIHP